MKRIRQSLTAGPATHRARPVPRHDAGGASAGGMRTWTSSITTPDPVRSGAPFTVTIGYGNNGPDTADSAYIQRVTSSHRWVSTSSSTTSSTATDRCTTPFRHRPTGTDTNGNAPLLFWDDFYCETVFFQLQGDDGIPDERRSRSTPFLPVRAAPSPLT